MKQSVVLMTTNGTWPYRNLVTCLQEKQWTVTRIPFPGKERVLSAIRVRRPDVVLLAVSCADCWDGIEVARDIRRRDVRIPLVLITMHSAEDLAIAALRAGINDYLKWPVPIEELIGSIQRCLALARNGDHTNDRAATAHGLLNGHSLIGESPSIQAVKGYIARVAAVDSHVLITGETGTGKELVAWLIHENSLRRQHPFVSLNCAAIPDSLCESELFGHDRGAFTGAVGTRKGVLECADKGTIFLDEIGDMSSYAQAKILRAIETKQITRLGSQGYIPLDIRIIAATNQNLEQRLEEGMFRKDLYFRLNVARLHLPPLRDRREDIPLLLRHAIQALNGRFNREIEEVNAETLHALLRHEWPGNVRELKNLIEAVFINNPPLRQITFQDLPDFFCRRLPKTKGQAKDERDCLLEALCSTSWNKSKTAQKLHWSRMTLYRKMAKYRILKDAMPQLVR